MKDKHTLRAHREGFLGRAVYKLEEINQKFNVIKKNDKVLDLGCYPGSWIQYLLTINCNISGLDLKDVKGLKFKFIKKDVYDNSIFDDLERSLDLCYRALEIAKMVLKPNGNFIVKIFDNTELKKYVNDAEKNFKKVLIFRPRVTKKRSKEIYIICKSK